MATNSGAVEPHCGICHHSSCNSDERTPFCSEWGQPTRIRIGTVCTEFSPSPGVSVASEERTVESATEPADSQSDEDERMRGSEGPFYAAYESDGETRFGWFCGNCESLEVAMDSMERIVCTRCDNDRKPRNWDAAYL